MRESPEERLEPLARPGDLVMKFLENEDRESEPSRSISFVGIEFKPLGYDQLADARLHLPATVPLDWSNAQVLETNVPGLDVVGYARGHATLESVLSSTTVSLQRGGWLPSGLALSRHGATVLPDCSKEGERRVLTEAATHPAAGEQLQLGRQLTIVPCPGAEIADIAAVRQAEALPWFLPFIQLAKAAA